MSFRIIIAVLLLVASIGRSEDKPAKPTQFREVKMLWIRTAQVGQYGPIAPVGNDALDDPGVRRKYKVSGTNSATQVVIEEESGMSDGGDFFDSKKGGVHEYAAHKFTMFMIEGIDASKFVSGRSIDLIGWFNVTRTARSKNGTYTILVLEPESEAQKKLRLEREAKQHAEAQKLRDEAEAAIAARKKAELKAKEEAGAKRLAEEEKRIVEREERSARAALNAAELYKGKTDKQKEVYRDVMKRYPSTKAAAEAKKLLESLPK